MDGLSSLIGPNAGTIYKDALSNLQGVNGMFSSLDDLLNQVTPEDRETIRVIMAKLPARDALVPSACRRGQPNARVSWVALNSGSVSVDCSCGQHISIRQEAIKSFVREQIAEWDKEIDAKRDRFEQLRRLRRNAKAEEPAKAKELKDLKRKLRKVLGVKSWGH